MYCGNCGQKLSGNEAFCPKCGTPVQPIEPPNVGSGRTGNEENGTYNYTGPAYSGVGETGNFGGPTQNGEAGEGWRAYLTPENIERFAPAATLAPLAMALVVGILGGILSALFGRSVHWVIVLLRLIFCLVTLAAAGGLSYVALTRKNPALVQTWVAPGAAFVSFVACLSITCGWHAPAWIFGIVSVVLGLELLARITLCNQPMDTPVQPGVAIQVYRDFIRQYKQQTQTSAEHMQDGQALENVPQREESYFDGSGAELLGYMILGIILSAVTCGIATPWVICKIYAWRLSHTVINGKRFTFDGSGASLLGHWILWEILTVITCGIYGFFTYVAVRKWEQKHTFIDGVPVVPGEETSYFDGNSFEFLGYGILGSLLMCITCCIATPWVVCMIQKWDTKHQVVNGYRLTFDGTGLGFLGEFILILLLTVITCGIYSPWGTVRMQKYIIRHTNFAD